MFQGSETNLLTLEWQVIHSQGVGIQGGSSFFLLLFFRPLEIDVESCPSANKLFGVVFLWSCDVTWVPVDRAGIPDGITTLRLPAPGTPSCLTPGAQVGFGGPCMHSFLGSSSIFNCQGTAGSPQCHCAGDTSESLMSLCWGQQWVPTGTLPGDTSECPVTVPGDTDESPMSLPGDSNESPMSPCPCSATFTQEGAAASPHLAVPHPHRQAAAVI